ncbi:hypothetical protein NDU88_004943 [Pleurodeles waltl]|uniref:SMB domain-containing protein n=1 Tax=Pleurodeles waltl TaxID=8319 RepID=A0AAV7V5W2_PLEWA|nr:hypothetical protein NDU88_004943 [Pleurodeles waltl]
MTWHSVALQLGFLLIWITTTEGQATTGRCGVPTRVCCLGEDYSNDCFRGDCLCGEGCVEGGECCWDYMEVCQGGNSSTAPTTTSTTEPGTTESSTHLATTGVLQCDPACADNELCTNSAGYSECKCQRSKYLNASRSDIVQTVQCEGSAMTLSLDKCLLERFKYSFTQMYFSNTNCTATNSLQLVGNERVVQVKAIPQAGWCGNEVTINNDKKMTHSNVLYIPPNNESGILISSTLRFNFSCTYNMTMQTSLLTALHPVIGTVSLPPVNGSGPITATMAAFKSNSFADPLTEGDTLTVGTPLYIGVSTTFSDGDTFTLRADRCVASPSNNPTDPGVELIAGGVKRWQETTPVSAIAARPTRELKWRLGQNRLGEAEPLVPGRAHLEPETSERPVRKPKPCSEARAPVDWGGGTTSIGGGLRTTRIAPALPPDGAGCEGLRQLDQERRRRRGPR